MRAWRVPQPGRAPRRSRYISFLRLLEDAGQSVVQALYLFETQGKDTLTVYSLIFSFCTIAYIFVCKMVAVIQKSDGSGARVYPR